LKIPNVPVEPSGELLGNMIFYLMDKLFSTASTPLTSRAS
jgi:hypothetical protein